MGVISNGTTLLDAGALDSGITTGDMILLSTVTASSSATISFTSGIGSTYKEYIFKFIDIHPSADNVDGLGFQVDTGTNTNYNQTITSSYFRATHGEDGTGAAVAYQASQDQAQATGFQNISQSVGTDNDQSIAGFLHLFDPSQTTFVKHFIARTNNAHQSDLSRDVHTAGYVNTTTALTRIQFKFNTGNIDAGTIKMYGIK